MNIAEYQRKYQNQPPEKRDVGPVNNIPNPGRRFNGNGFTLNYYEGFYTQPV